MGRQGTRTSPGEFAAWLGAAALLAVAALGSSAATAAPSAGSIWTTAGDCTSPNQQDQNQYNIGDPVVIRGSNFDPSTQYTYTVEGQPGQASNDPGAVVASGFVTTDGSGYFCVSAYVVAGDDGGTYKVSAAGKQDNYSVVGATPTPTPTPTPTTTPTPTPTPDSSPTPTPDPSATPAPSGDLNAGSAQVSPPPTDASSGRHGSADGLGLVLMALAGALAGVMVLTPTRVRRL